MLHSSNSGMRNLSCLCMNVDGGSNCCIRRICRAKWNIGTHYLHIGHRASTKPISYQANKKLASVAKQANAEWRVSILSSNVALCRRHDLPRSRHTDPWECSGFASADEWHGRNNNDYNLHGTSAHVIVHHQPARRGAQFGKTPTDPVACICTVRCDL
jgi:hypothetical protein